MDPSSTRKAPDSECLVQEPSQKKQKHCLNALESVGATSSTRKAPDSECFVQEPSQKKQKYCLNDALESVGADMHEGVHTRSCGLFDFPETTWPCSPEHEHEHEPSQIDHDYLDAFRTVLVLVNWANVLRQQKRLVIRTQVDNGARHYS